MHFRNLIICITAVVGSLLISDDAHAVDGHGGFIDIAVGSWHSCALKSNGRVACWGDNTYGQLGTQGGGYAVAREIEGVRGGFALAAHGNNTCLVLVDGGLACWGYNFGTVHRVAGISDIKQIALGNSHFCALRWTGEVACWGNNTNGQLGVGSNISTVIPAVVSGLDSVAEIKTGDSHTCARKENGEVFCWGSNSAGQLGDSGMGDANLPRKVLNEPATSMALGGAFTCITSPRPVPGIPPAEVVRCWGDNSYGQFGIGIRSVTPVAPIDSAIGVLPIAISAGKAYGCYVDRNRRISCAGTNGQGQLGAGSIESESSSLRTVMVLDLRPLGNMSKISSGYLHTCGLNLDGYAFCWGYNKNGQVGNGNFGSNDNLESPVVFASSVIDDSIFIDGFNKGV